MQYVVTIKKDLENNYFLLTDTAIDAGGMVYTTFKLSFAEPGKITLKRSNVRISVLEMFEQCDVCFAAIDLMQLVGFFQTQGFTMMPTGLIDEAAAFKFQRYVNSKKSSIVIPKN